MKNYIICLSNIPASLNSGLRLQKELADFKIEAELFEGSYGDQALTQYQKNNRHCHPWGFKGPDVLFLDQCKQDRTTPGIIGCFDSHYRLWKLCADSDQPIVIWEDDAHVIRPYYPVEWTDVLVLASSHTKKMEKYKHYLEAPTGDPTAEYYQRSSLPGAAGYAIKPHAAQKLVEFYHQSFLPADNAINQYIVKIQIHNYMMGQAQDRERTHGRSSLIKSTIWNKEN